MSNKYPATSLSQLCIFEQKSNSKATLNSLINAANKLDNKEQEEKNTGNNSDDEPLINLKSDTPKSKRKKDEVVSPTPSPKKRKKQDFETITDDNDELER